MESSRAADVERISALAAGCAEQTEAQRRVPESLIAQIKAAGLFRLRQPRRWGGEELSALESFGVIYRLAQACGSTGWVFSVLMSHGGQIGQFPAAAQEEVWGPDAGALASSSYAPVGRARRVEGGYRLSGRFSFSSGCDHAQWAIVGGMIEGEPRPGLFLVPLRELEIIDDWFTLGLRGTGSKTLAAGEVLVPEHRVRPPGLFAGGLGPFSLAVVLVGIARGAVDQFRSDMIEAPPGRQGRPADSEMIQGAFGRALGQADAAWLLLRRAVEEVQTYSYDGFDLPQALRARNRSDTAMITRCAVSAVNGLMSVAGGRAVYDGHPLQRRFRDANTAANHVALTSAAAAKDAGLAILRPERPWP
jgi:3-hydroxy-9,10-secoandrosta-1,3,5(10)-triene-9,17-dione monooxygenase